MSNLPPDRPRLPKMREKYGEGMEKGAKVTVYYSEDAGKKVAHFFEKS